MASTSSPSSKMAAKRAPLNSEDTFADLEASIHNGLNDDDSEDEHVQMSPLLSTPQQSSSAKMPLEEENDALRTQLEELQSELEYWKSKANSNTSNANAASNQGPGLWEGLKNISFAIQENDTTAATPNDTDNDNEDDTTTSYFSNKTGLYHRRSAKEEAAFRRHSDNTTAYDWNKLSPFRFASARISASNNNDDENDEGVSLVALKSHASDKADNDDLDDDDSHAHHVHGSTTNHNNHHHHHHAIHNIDEEPASSSMEESNSLIDRGAWLVGLLVLQSCSSFIIKNNEVMLQRHAVIVRFLTMLVGAGGNAGNQASVRVIRGLATGKVTEDNVRAYLFGELRAGFFLSFVLGVAGLVRAAVFFTPLAETMAITTSLVMIVGISIFLGTILPLLMKMVHIDPAHSSTTIQVLMDILGVAITVYVSSMVLDSKLFAFLPRGKGDVAGEGDD